MLLEVNKPSQFTLSPGVGETGTLYIYDETGNVYYFREYSYNVDGSSFKVNIPHKGKYVIDFDCLITKCTKIPIPRTPKLDKPTRNRYKEVKVVVNEDMWDSPAEIYTDLGLVVLSPIVYDMPVQIRDFVIAHEKAHLLYHNESSCDIFALASCLRMGYNRSMCAYALINYLNKSPENVERINILVDSIQTTQKNKIIWT